MKNLLTLVALLISISGIAASLLREEVRCYLGLPSQSCFTSEKSSPPISAPEQPQKREVKALQPQPVNPPQSSPQEKSEQHLPIEESLSPSPTETNSLEEVQIPVESAKVDDSDREKTSDQPEAEEGIPIPVEPFNASN